MTDRELLELAAKAAGLGKPYKWNGWPYPKKSQFIDENNNITFFDPLTDDGDALRLAVKLRFIVNISDLMERTRVLYDGCHVDYKHKGDPYAATRRAIVRAAAEIGRNMQ